MVIISPSLLAGDFLNIETELKRLEQINDIWLHLDIMDGHFVPNLTFGHPIIKKIAAATNIPLDAHCMVSNPEFYIESFKKYDLANITFHYESHGNPIALIEMAKLHFPHVGLSIKPKTLIEDLSLDLLSKIDLLLLMSVEPGFSGQSFIPASFERLKQLNAIKNQHGYNFTIQVDGGVSNQNAKQLIELGAQNLVAGSYIFNKPPSNYKDQIDSLRLF